MTYQKNNSNISSKRKQLNKKDNTKKNSHNTKVKNNKEADPSLLSNASNYKNPVSYLVDPRTGNLQASITPPTLSGFFGSAITPAIHYTQQQVNTGNRMLGLPLGWSYHFSFIANGCVYVNGQSPYYIDSVYPSGMQYYNLKNVVFTECKSPTPFPYDTTLEYSSFLSFYNGETHYLDTFGRLIGISDRFKNHVIFYYNGEDSVYNSTLSKIIDSYGQTILFSYLDSGIQITYPSNIQFTYLIDANLQLSGYIDPLNQTTTIENTKGLNDNLISQICRPNGLNIQYQYTTLSYLIDGNNTQLLDAVSQVQQIYQSETRTIQYNYNSTGPYNYTGYPTYSTSSISDTLLQSNDNTYRYSTQVDDGIFMTEHVYNSLHLELQRNIFPSASTTLIQQITNTYEGEDSNQCFPHYNELPANYQTPTKILTDVYNDAGEKRSHCVETVFDDYGNRTCVTTYETNLDSNTMSLVSIEKTTYNYDSGYGQIIEKDFFDYTPSNHSDSNASIDIIVRKSISTLTTDNKNIATTTNGFVVTSNDNDTFQKSKETTFSYDSFGRVVSEELAWVDNENHTLSNTNSSVTYSVACPVMTITKTDAQNQSTVAQVDTTTGHISNEKDPLGNITRYTYDKVGRLLTITDPLGVVTSSIYTDTEGKVTTQYANGYETYSYYNGFNDLIKTSDNLGENQAERILSTKTYNNLGQLISEEGILGENSIITYTYTTRGQIESMTDVLGNITQYVYDPVAQTQITYFNDNKINQSCYNNCINSQEVFSTTNPTEAVTTTQYRNAYNKTTTEILGDITSNNWYKTHYFYDVDLNLTSSEMEGSDNIKSQCLMQKDLFSNTILGTVHTNLPNDPNPMTTTGSTYTYDNLNQLIEECNSLGKSYSCTYNDSGMPIAYTDYAGTVFTSTYYANNQVASVSYQDKSGKTHKKQFTYYPLTHQLQSIEDFCEGVSQGSIQHSYTVDGKLETMTYPDEKTITLTYDEEKNLLSSFKDALDNVTQYQYDTYGRLIEIEQLGYNITINYYDKGEDAANSGQIQSITTSNGIQNVYTYDGFGSIQTLNVVDTNIEKDNNVLLNITYTYDLLTKNITQHTYTSQVSPQEINLNHITTYNYNTLNQLISEKTTDLSEKLLNSITYEYDAANNVTTETITDSNNQTQTIHYTYDNDNKLIQINDQVLTYDDNGNLIQDGAGATFTYDENNYLIGYQNSDTQISATYTYYPNGLRATKSTTTDDLIQFYYDGATNPNIINEVQSNTSTSYLMIGSKRYVRLLHNASQAIPQYLIDNVKDTLGIVNSNNQMEETYSYSPYGEESSLKTISSLDIENNPFQYTEEYVDIESGLVYLRARYYHPSIKRFISRDTAILMNCYNYGNGNPIMNIDPSGHSAESIFSIMLGAAIILGAIGLTIATAGTASPVLVAASIGAAMGAGTASIAYGATHMNNFNWGQWGVMTSLGAGFGAIGGAGAVGAGALTAGFESVLPALGLDIALNTGLGALDGYVTNGTLNAMSGQSFDTGAGAAAGFGALFGAVVSGVLGGFGRGLGRINRAALQDGIDHPEASFQVTLGRKGFGMGHNRIVVRGAQRVENGIVFEANGTFDLEAGNGNKALWWLSTTGIRRVAANVLRADPYEQAHPTISTSVARASRAYQFLQGRIQAGPTRYSVFTNNCATLAADGLTRAGFRVPLFARTPWLLYTWFGALSRGA